MSLGCEATFFVQIFGLQADELQETYNVLEF